MFVSPTTNRALERSLNGQMVKEGRNAGYSLNCLLWFGFFLNNCQVICCNFYFLFVQGNLQAQQGHLGKEGDLPPFSSSSQHNLDALFSCLQSSVPPPPKSCFQVSSERSGSSLQHPQACGEVEAGITSFVKLCS